MTDTKIRAIPTATDETMAAVNVLIRALPVLSPATKQIAEYRKASYDAHIAVGFTPEQALALCKSITL